MQDVSAESIQKHTLTPDPKSHFIFFLFFFFPTCSQVESCSEGWI